MKNSKNNFYTLPLDIFQIQNDGYHLFVDVLINKKKARLLVDTGASKTVIDIGRIKRFTRSKKYTLNEQLSTGLGTNSMQSHTMIIKEFKLGDYLLTKFLAVLLDISHVNKSYKLIDFPPIDGVLGSDLLFDLGSVIDYKKRILKIYPPKI